MQCARIGLLSIDRIHRPEATIIWVEKAGAVAVEAQFTVELFTGISVNILRGGASVGCSDQNTKSIVGVRFCDCPALAYQEANVIMTIQAIKAHLPDVAVQYSLC